MVRESLTELWSGSALGFLGLAAANTLPITVVIERLSAPAGWIAEAARLAGCEARVIEGPASAVLAACEDGHGANGPWVLEVTHRLDGSSFDGERDVAGSVPVIWPRVTSVRELMMLDDRAVVIGSAPDLASSFGLHRVLDVELGLASRVGLGRGLAQSGLPCVVVEPIPSDGSGVWPAPPKVEVLCEPWVTPATSMVVLFRAAGAEPVRQPQTEFAGVVVVTIGPWRASVPPGVECVVISRLRPCVDELPAETSGELAIELAIVVAAVLRRGRAIVLAPEPYAAELAHAIGHACFYDLDAPVARVSDPTQLSKVASALRQR